MNNKQDQFITMRGRTTTTETYHIPNLIHQDHRKCIEAKWMMLYVIMDRCTTYMVMSRQVTPKNNLKVYKGTRYT